jgi:predicted AlkP superfamily pyrophosphatase or phosphodiesterase
MRDAGTSSSPLSSLSPRCSLIPPPSSPRSPFPLFSLVALLALVAACAETPQPRVLLISLDGFRWDYLDRPGAVNLRALAARGVRAERMIPSFPSKTFPNHYSLVTGLTPEHHGLVANSMRDPELGLFRSSDSVAQHEPRWWGGEPIWVTAERQGLRAASYFWPGSEAPIGGKRQGWWKRYNGDVPRETRVRQVIEWLALPADLAPAVITLYFSDTDDAGHRFRPASPQVDSAIARVDSAVGAILAGIDSLSLREVVNVIIVADHGMTEVSGDRLIVLDDYIDVATLDVVDWTPVSAIAPRDDNAERVYRSLAGKHPHMQVYRKGEVPARFHFNAHPRITPIVAVADEGWVITDRASLARRGGPAAVTGAAHGYDPEVVNMGAVFIAAGPGVAEGRVIAPFRNIHVYELMTRLLGIAPAPNDGSLDSLRNVLREPNIPR